MTEEQRKALALIDYLESATEVDAVTIGLSDAELIVRALRVFAPRLAAPERSSQSYFQ